MLRVVWYGSRHGNDLDIGRLQITEICNARVWWETTTPSSGPGGDAIIILSTPGELQGGGGVELREEGPRSKEEAPRSTVEVPRSD